jgi:hypothetical protein
MPWLTPVITAFRKLRQEDYKFKASLGYMARPMYIYILFETIAFVDVFNPPSLALRLDFCAHFSGCVYYV